MQPSASVSTSGVPSQGSGGGVARGFKGRNFGVSMLTKFNQLVEMTGRLLARAPKAINEDERC